VSGTVYMADNVNFSGLFLASDPIAICDSSRSI
jgi:hypothetical protein